MTRQETNLAYPDLQDADQVFRALLGYGMFNNKMPPCFKSEDLLDHNLEKEITLTPCDYIRYLSTRHTSVPRPMGIPHPMAYYALCNVIKDHWDDINIHIGKPSRKISRKHLEKIPDEKHIFEMNWHGYGKYNSEAEDIKNMAHCRLVVQADIANCFPSIYSHSLPWAVLGKQQAKESYRQRQGDSWADKLDKHARHLKYNETNGLLIGPHASNLLAEIVLTAIDQKLLERDFTRLHRYIDDYTFYADSKEKVAEFLHDLFIALREYDLTLNEKKTKITSVIDINPLSERWITKLYQFHFSPTTLAHGKSIGFTSVNAYIEYALDICNKDNDFRPLNFAIKLLSSRYGNILSKRARKLYAQKIFGLAIQRPYLLPLLEPYVMKWLNITGPKCEQHSDHTDMLKSFACSLLSESLTNINTDAIAFSLYYMIKYDVKKSTSIETDLSSILDINDCISMTLAYEYTKKNGLSIDKFKDKANELAQDEQSCDQYWLFIYQVFTDSCFQQKIKEIPSCNPTQKDKALKIKMQFMKKIKNKKVNFLKL